MLRSRWVVSSVLGGGVVVACAGGGDDGGGACPPDTYSLDNTPAGHCAYKCTPGPNAPNDPIDPQYTDENCDGTDGVVDKLIFVASDGNDAPNGGTRDAPMKTIRFAIQQAQTEGKDVAISGETWTGEVDLVSGVSIYGGFNEHADGFAFRRDPTRRRR